MSTSTSSISPAPEVVTADVEMTERASIDISMRWPVLSLFSFAIVWLLIGTILGATSVMKLIWPDFLDETSFTTFGRIWPAYYNVLVYGWVMQAGLGVVLWITARLCRVEVKRPGWIVAGAVLWNAGVLAGIASILLGQGSGYPFLEFPNSVSIILSLAWMIMAGWMLVMFWKRRPGHAFISLWYFVAGVIWFPALLLGSKALLSSGTLHGVMLPIVAAWYMHALLYLVLPAIGLGVVYYMIPKVIGRPIHSYYLASMGFWSLLLFAGWGGMTRLNGGPVPAWLITVSISSVMLMLVPIATVTVNYAITMRDHLHMVYHSPAIRFVFFGAIAYSVAGVLAMIFSFRSVARITQFSDVGVGQWHLIVYAFLSMVLFGAIYYIAPRLVGCEWFSPAMIRLHFWGAGYGIGFAIFLYIIGGIATGAAWNDVTNSNSQVIEAAQPFMFSRLLPWFLALPAHFVFGLHFVMMLLRMGRPAGTPTLFAPLEVEK